MGIYTPRRQPDETLIGQLTDALTKTLASALPAHGDKLMTIAEKWKQQGRQEGRQEGLLDTARNLIRDTELADRVIAAATGLDASRVAALRRELRE